MKLARPFLALALLAAAPGCVQSYQLTETISEKLEAPLEPGAETLDVRVRCIARSAPVEVYVPGEGMRPFQPFEDARAQGELRDLLARTRRFARVEVGVTEDPAPGEVQLVYSRRVGDMPRQPAAQHVTCFLIGLCLFPVGLVSFGFYWEQEPLLVASFALQARTHEGDVATYTTDVSFRLEAPLAGVPGAALPELGRIAEDRALPVLVGKLLRDEALRAKLRAGPAAAKPKPAPAPAPAPVATGAGATYVLVVGVDSYADPKVPPLRFAEADAREVYAFFATERRSPTRADRVQLLAGREATRKRVLAAVREHLAAKAIEPDDTAILYFAGHGFADASDTYLACHDTELDSLPETGIALGQLGETWSRVRAGRKLVVLDACHAGVLGGRFRGIGGVTLAPAATASAALAIAATGPNELSAEDDKLGHGVFTIAFLKGLRGEADRDGDGRVAGDELGAYLTLEVPKLAQLVQGKQTPVIQGTGRGMLLTR